MMNTMKRAAFWDVMPCNVADHYEHFRGHCWLHLHSSTLKMETACSFETLVMIYQTIIIIIIIICWHIHQDVLSCDKASLPSKLAQAVMLLHCILEGPYSNLSQDTILTGLSWFSLVLSLGCQGSISKFAMTISFQIHYSLLVTTHPNIQRYIDRITCSIIQ